MLDIKAEVFKIFIPLKIINALYANINYIFIKNNYFLKQKIRIQTRRCFTFCKTFTFSKRNFNQGRRMTLFYY